MEFLSLSRRRSSSRNVPNGEERGETAVFAGYDHTCFQSVCVEKRLPPTIERVIGYHRKGDRSRRGTLLAERKSMKRWRSGRLNPYTPDNVSTYKRGLKWLTGNRYRVVT